MIKTYLDFCDISLWDEFFSLPALEPLREYLPVLWLIRLLSLFPLIMLMNILLDTALRWIKFNPDNDENLIPKSIYWRCESKPKVFHTGTQRGYDIPEEKGTFKFRPDNLIAAVYTRCNAPGVCPEHQCRNRHKKPFRCVQREFNDRFVLWVYVFLKHFVIPYAAVSISGWMIFLRCHPLWFVICWFLISWFFKGWAIRRGLLIPSPLTSDEKTSIHQKKIEHDIQEMRESQRRLEFDRWIFGWWW